MFVLGNFLVAVAKILDVVLTMYYRVILIRALISWVSPDPFNPIVRFLETMTEPVLEPLRRLVPAHRMGIDIAPIIAFLLILFLKYFLVTTIMSLGYRLQ